MGLYRPLAGFYRRSPPESDRSPDWRKKSFLDRLEASKFRTLPPRHLDSDSIRENRHETTLPVFHLGYIIQIDRLRPVRLEENLGVNSAQHTLESAIHHRPAFISENQLRVGIPSLQQMNVTYLEKHIFRPIPEHRGFVPEENPDLFRIGGLTNSLQTLLEAMRIDRLEKIIHSLCLEGPNGMLGMGCDKNHRDSLSGQRFKKIKTLLPTPKLDIQKHHIRALLGNGFHSLLDRTRLANICNTYISERVF